MARGADRPIVPLINVEPIVGPPEDWARETLGRFGNDVVVIGPGASGAVLAVRSESVVERAGTAPAPAIVSTVGPATRDASAGGRGRKPAEWLRLGKAESAQHLGDAPRLGVARRWAVGRVAVEAL